MASGSSESKFCFVHVLTLFTVDQHEILYGREAVQHESFDITLDHG